MVPFRGYAKYEGWNSNVDIWRIVFSVPQTNEVAFSVPYNLP